MTKKIILTGGGTAGHVTSNIALLPMLTGHRYDILYIGSYNGIEKNLLPLKILHTKEYLQANSDVILI